GVDHLPPRFIADLRHFPVAIGHAGVVDEDVDPAGRPDQTFSRGVDRPAVAHVDRIDRQAIAHLLPQPFDRCGDANIPDRDGRAFVEEPRGDGTADAAGAACDDRDAAGKAARLRCSLTAHDALLPSSRTSRTVTLRPGSGTSRSAAGGSPTRNSMA